MTTFRLDLDGSYQRFLLGIALAALAGSTGCKGKPKAEPASEHGGGTAQPGHPARPVDSTPRLRELATVDLAGTYTITLGSGATAKAGTVTLGKAGDERYVGSAEIGGKKFSALAHRDGNSLAGLFKPKNDGTWIGHYKVFCDHALEGSIVEPISKSVGLEFATATSDTLEGKSTVKYAKNFDGRYSGSFTLKADGDALIGSYDHSDGWAGNAVGVRIGDSLAVGHELGSGNFYVFNLLIGDSSAATLVGTTASRSQLKPATSTAMSWSRAVAAGGAAAMAPTGGSTETFASGGACIKAPADGHALEAQLTPKGGAGGGGNGKGSQKAADCARLVGHHGICDGYNCTDLDSDNHNCGSCGHDCDSQSCWQGVCN